METLETNQEVKTHKIAFKKDRVYELTFADIILEKSDQLNNEYFPQAMPVFEKYNVAVLGGFSVVKNESELLPGNFVGIFEWPEAASRLRYLDDPVLKEIGHLRDEAVKSINLGFFTVEEDVEVEFRSDKVYEFVSADLNPGEEAKAELQKYFEISEPIKHVYGGSYPAFKAKFQTTDSEGQATFKPHIQLLVEWDSVEDNEKLYTNEEFVVNALPHFNKALRSIDVVFTRFDF